jgi:hypothetical protein
MKNRLASAAAAIGVALLSMGAFPTTAHAGSTDIYDAGGSGQGILFTAAVRPSIFDPLVQGGVAYSEATLSSSGGGASGSFAAALYPGKFGIGALGCSGAPGGPWHQAQYPPAGVCNEHEEGALVARPASLGNANLDMVMDTAFTNTDVKTGYMSADAHLDESHSLVRMQRVALVPDPSQPSPFEVGSVTVAADGERTADHATHSVRSSVKDVSLLAGALTIAEIVSTTHTLSDGVTATADATLTFKDVRAFVSGAYHHATIDNEGVHIDDPTLTRAQNLSQTESFGDSLADANISITVGTPVELVDGSAADASVGGLTLAVRGTVPSVKVPSELAPVITEVIKQIPTKCLNDIGGPLPLCFGSGVVPGFGSQVVYSISIGGASSRSVAYAGYVYTPPVCTQNCGGFVPPGGPITYPTPDIPTFGPGPVAGDQPVQQIQPGPTTAGGPLVGLVARLPAAALIWAGAAFLILAVGTALAPSLRDA